MENQPWDRGIEYNCCYKADVEVRGKYGALMTTIESTPLTLQRMHPFVPWKLQAENETLLPRYDPLQSAIGYVNLHLNYWLYVV